MTMTNAMMGATGEHMHHQMSVFNAQSPQAASIVHLFYVDLAIAAVIFLTVTALVIAAVIRFRARPGDAEPYQDPGNPRLEALWTVIPALILLVLLILTARTMLAVNPPVHHGVVHGTAGAHGKGPVCLGILPGKCGNDTGVCPWAGDAREIGSLCVLHQEACSSKRFVACSTKGLNGARPR